MPKELLDEIKELMIRYKFKPDKKFSQYFIVDKNIINRLITEANLKEDDIVLEIGPGVGFLTQELVKKCSVVAIESDIKMVEILRERIKNKNLKIVEGDFLKVEIPKFNKIVSLPPYAISSDIINKIVFLDFQEAYLVFQKEFCNRLTALPGFFEYGAITITTNYFCDVKILVDNIPPSSFYPSPKSFSSAVCLKKKKSKTSVKNETLFVDFVSNLFRYRNKNLRNALINSSDFFCKKTNINKKLFLEKIESLRYKDEKVYLLEVDDFVKIFNILF